MKQYVKSLDKGGECFKYICQKFSFLSHEKLKAGVFDGPNYLCVRPHARFACLSSDLATTTGRLLGPHHLSAIKCIPLSALPKDTTRKLAGFFSKDKVFGTKIRQLLKNKEFIETMSSVEKKGWITFSQVVNNFLGNTKSPEYKEIVKTLLDTFHKLGCNMSVKVHFLHSHLEYFPENLGALSEEQGERFHQDIKIMQKRYQGRWNVNMTEDYSWCLMRDEENFKPSRKSRK